MIKKLPTAQSSLQVFIDTNLVFIDKTKSIETYETSKSRVSMFLRPRRFGKTTFIEMMKYYYDEALKDESDRIFEGSYIASHPTPKKSGYYVVSFDFSGIETNKSSDKVLELFGDRVIAGIKEFFERYPDLAPLTILETIPAGRKKYLPDYVVMYYKNKQSFVSGAAIISEFLLLLGTSQHKVMVLIDEYDNFCEDVLGRNVKSFRDLVSKDENIATFYQILRSFQLQITIDRIFVAGVLPIVLDMSLSGFVYDSVYEYPEFNDMVGFTDDDVASLLKDTVDFEKSCFSPDILREEMKRRYGGYIFSPYSQHADSAIYNPALCLKFVEQFADRKYAEIPPLQTVQDNDADFNALSCYMNLVNEEDRNSIVSRLDVDSDPDDTFSAGYTGIHALSGSIKVTSEKNKLNYSSDVTLLYHLGFLTIMAKEEASSIVEGYRSGITYLKIPNLHCKNLFSRYHLSRYPAVYATVMNNAWNLGLLAQRNDILCLEKMLNSIAEAFANLSDDSIDESLLTLAVYVALNTIPEAPFNLVRKYGIKHANQHVFSDGLEDDEYQDVDEKAVEKQLMEEGIIPKSEKDECDDSPAVATSEVVPEQDNFPYDFIRDFLNQDIDHRPGRRIRTGRLEPQKRPRRSGGHQHQRRSKLYFRVQIPQGLQRPPRNHGQSVRHTLEKSGKTACLLCYRRQTEQTPGSSQVCRHVRLWRGLYSGEALKERC